jgi:hypothetical protein
MLAAAVLREDASVPEPTQVVRGGGWLDLAELGQLPNGVFPVGEELEHPQSNGMSYGLQALGRLPQSLPIEHEPLS